MSGDQFLAHAAHDEQDEKIRVDKKPGRGIELSGNSGQDAIRDRYHMTVFVINAHDFIGTRRILLAERSKQFVPMIPRTMKTDGYLPVVRLMVKIHFFKTNVCNRFIRK